MTAMMKIDLVTAEKGQPMTTSLAIADGLGIQHKNVLAMVRKHRKRFDRFGPLAFQTRMGKPLPQGGFAKATEVALLNEPQASLLLTMQRNTARVMDFKEALIAAFFEARALLQSGCLSLLEQRAALNAVYESEKQQASVHGSGLNQWKHHKQGLQQAIHQINMQLQPLLTGWSE